MIFKKLSFRVKILIPVLAAVLFSFSVMGFVVYSSFEEEVNTLAQTRAWEMAYNTANIVKDTFGDALAVVNSLSATAVLLDNGDFDEKEIFAYLEDIASQSSEIHSFFMVWDENKYAPVVTVTNNKIMRSFLPEISGSWYDKPMRSDGTRSFISDPDMYDYGGGIRATVITISKAFRIDGKNAGIVGVDISVDMLFNELDDIKIYDNGYAYLVANDDTVLTHKDIMSVKPDFVNLIKDYTARKEPFEMMTVSDGENMFNVYVPVLFEHSDNYYYISLSIPMEEMHAAIHSARNILIISAILAMIMVSVVVFVVVRGLMKMLGGEPGYVINKVNEIASGNFATELKVQANDHSSLLYYIKSMSEDLKGIIAGSIDIADSLRNASADLSSGAQELSTGMADQASQTEQISSATAEMSATTADIAKNLDDIASFTNETSNKVVGGTQAVEEALVEIVKIKETADNASLLVEGLEAKSDEIRNIIDAITAIADQTNLLALNAAIEAARAGDAGRGFAVVADEVRKLAEKTQGSTDEISKLVADIQSEVYNVTNSMHGVTSQVDQGVSASKVISSILKEIDDVVVKLKDMVNDISGATQEMSATSSQIQKDISDVAVVSNEVRTTTEYLAKNATDLDSISNTLKTMMERFKI